LNWVLVLQPKPYQASPGGDHQTFQLNSGQGPKEPADRYQTPAEVKIAIQQISSKLAGNPFQQFSKKAFPNGFRDAQGKKSAVLVLTVFLAVSGSTFLMAKLLSGSNGQAPVVVATPLKWSAYDLRGQQLFDRGSHREAEKQFLLAAAKAKTEAPGKRSLHLYTSLQELRMIYHVLGDKEGTDRTNAELLDVSAPTSGEGPAHFSWEILLERASKVRQNDELDSIIYGATVLLISGDGQAQSGDARQMLANIRNKVASNKSRIGLDQLTLLEAFCLSRESQSLSSDAFDAISRLTEVNPSQLAPGVANILVNMGLQEPKFSAQKFEKFSSHVIQESVSFRDRQLAQIDLAKIYFVTGRKSAAISSIEKCLAELEKRIPRLHWIILQALCARASLHSAGGNYAAAIPLYIRSISIAECVPTKHLRNLSTADFFRSLLAEAYMHNSQFSDAERILLTLVDNKDRLRPEQRAHWLQQLGRLYNLQKKYVSAEKCLSESVAIFAKVKALDTFYSNKYQVALSELTYARTKSGEKDSQ